MNYSIINAWDCANGEGVRVSLFVSGCPHKCKGCFNPEAWDYDFGKVFDESILDMLIALMSKSTIQGLTILGGEPLAPKNRDTIAYIGQRCKEELPDKDIWCYTGYDYEEVSDCDALKYIDVLIDGRYVEEERDISLQFKGSHNQRTIDLNKTRECGEVQLWSCSGRSRS